jgi:hypothetical protein
MSHKLISSLNPLSYFLQTSMLSTDTESQEDEGKQPVSCPLLDNAKADISESNDNNSPQCQRPRMACGIHTSSGAGYIPLIQVCRGT